MTRRYALAGIPIAAFALRLMMACTEAPTVPFGNPNSLDRRNIPGEGGAAALSCDGFAARFDGGCPSFANDIYPNLRATGRYKCADSTCHGGARSPDITDGDPTSCLSSLKAIDLFGKPYIAEGNTDPNASTMLCNLQGACGSRMPKAPLPEVTPDDLCTVDAWLKCGAPP